MQIQPSIISGTGYPLHRENGRKKSLSYQGKHREFGFFSKTQGIWFAKVVKSLILNVKDISICCPENFQFWFEAG